MERSITMVLAQLAVLKAGAALIFHSIPQRSRAAHVHAARLRRTSVVDATIIGRGIHARRSDQSLLRSILLPPDRTRGQSNLETTSPWTTRLCDLHLRVRPDNLRESRFRIPVLRISLRGISVRMASLPAIARRNLPDPHSTLPSGSYGLILPPAPASTFPTKKHASPRSISCNGWTKTESPSASCPRRSPKP